MSDSKTVVSIVRHGEVHNPSQVYYGRLPRYGLSELGRRQADETGATFTQGSIAAVYASPLLRARQTAALIAAHHGVDVKRTEKLLEVHSPFDGTTLSDMNLRGWDLYSGTRAPYEQPDDIVARMRSFVRMARRRHSGGHVVGVSHGDPFAFTALWAAGQPAKIALRDDLGAIGIPDIRAGHASVLEMRFDSTSVLPTSFSYRRSPAAAPLLV